VGGHGVLGHALVAFRVVLVGGVTLMHSSNMGVAGHRHLVAWCMALVIWARFTSGQAIDLREDLNRANVGLPTR
jgi:hypothetical protein